MRRILVSLAATLAVFGLVLGVPNAASVSPATAAASTPAWMKNAVIYEVNVRQYTEAGTFDAFATHLPRLKELGVDVLWFMPIFPISELNPKGQPRFALFDCRLQSGKPRVRHRARFQGPG